MAILYQKVVKQEHEFVEPNPSDHFIWWLFRHRCIECRQKADEINEIIPRARSKKALADFRNRVTLCRDCHQKYHHLGVTNAKIESMRETRKKFLVSIDRGMYV